MQGIRFIILLIFSFAASMVSAQFNMALLPAGWTLTKTITVPEAQLPAFSRKLGGRVTAIENYNIDAGGVELWINIARCAKESDARVVYRAFAKAHESEIFCLRKGVDVYEFRSPSNLIPLIKKARSLFTPDPGIVHYRVEMDVAPLSGGDYENWNRFFTMLMRYCGGERNPELLDDISRMTHGFRFSHELPLCDRRWGTDETSYTIADAHEAVPRGDVILFACKEIPKELGIPRMHVVAKIPVKPFSFYASGADADHEVLTGATRFWPVHADYIQTIVTPYQAIADEEQRAEKLLLWVSSNIRFGGEKKGSRYGVKQVLDQGFGHCWDKSDVYVTLCRAAGLAAREVAGWLHGSSGHIWTEIYITGKGWMPVDATAFFTGVSDDYIPFFIMENGEMPAVYWDVPLISRTDDDR